MIGSDRFDLFDLVQFVQLAGLVFRWISVRLSRYRFSSFQFDLIGSFSVRTGFDLSVVGAGSGGVSGPVGPVGVGGWLFGCCWSSVVGCCRLSIVGDRYGGIVGCWLIVDWLLLLWWLVVVDGR